MFRMINYIRMTAILSSIFYMCSSHAASISFSGSILNVYADNGAGVYTGTTVGDTFTGDFIFGNAASDATSSEVWQFDEGVPVAFAWEFTGSPYGGAITGGGVSTSSSSSVVGIGDNAPISMNEANFLSNLFGTSIAGGTQFDSWDAISLTDGAFFDINDNLTDGLEFGIALWFDTSLNTGLDFRATPPTLADVDYGIFLIKEGDALGNEMFFAVGTLDSLTAIPVPATVWLLCSGLLGLLAVTKRKKMKI